MCSQGVFECRSLLDPLDKPCIFPHRATQSPIPVLTELSPRISGARSHCATGRILLFSFHLFEPTWIDSMTPSQHDKWAWLGTTDMVHEPSTSQARAAALDETPWANEFQWETLQALAGYMHLFRIPQNGVLFHEYATESYLCILVEGRVTVRKESSTGESKVLGERTKGNVIGEMSLLDGCPRSATLVAATDVTVLIFGEEDLERMTSELPQEAIRLLRRIGRDVSMRLRKASGELVERD